MIDLRTVALPAALVAVSLLASAAIALRPVPGAPLLAFFTDGAAPLHAVAAGGLPVIEGPFGSVLVRGDDPALAARLAASGAWLVLRADALLGCAVLFFPARG
ncbi:hypothetical protein [Elioraea sp.]|uniref:hypothetical protein n=1 Tax=Elioraea sp. TaxID=2185103 RepID=UPI0025BC8529|nr:hypothetical protein [Elioraea sp.]